MSIDNIHEDSQVGKTFRRWHQMLPSSARQLERMLILNGYSREGSPKLAEELIEWARKNEIVSYIHESVIRQGAVGLEPLK